MDPITAAAKRFVTQIEGFWHHPPTAPNAPGPRVLRMVAAPTERSSVLKALRWLEWSPENRRPLVLFEDAFNDEPCWLRALVAKVADDCDAVRAGLTGNGITQTMTPPPKPAAAALDAVMAIRYLEATARSLINEVLDGIFVAVVPEHVTDSKAYRAAVARIAVLPFDTDLRIAVLDIPGADLGVLLPGEARFELDRDALLAFLEQLGPRPSQGPPVRPTGAPCSPAHAT